MKVFFHLTNNVDPFIHKWLISPSSLYNDIVKHLLSSGSTSMLGADPTLIGENHFVCYSRSEKLQKIWANEYGLSYSLDWCLEILNEQINSFKPDVVYTMSPEWFTSNYAKISKSGILAAWKASPINAKSQYVNFNVSLTFNKAYSEELRKHGAKNIELQQFVFNHRIVQDFLHLKKASDISFCGTYNDTMFGYRTECLHKLFESFFLRAKIRFHFNASSKRFAGLLPNIPLKFQPITRKPLFFLDFIRQIRQSKIVFNCHSDITGQEKGNMRVFETMGMGSFLLTDAGVYPPGLIDGRDFISYLSPKDLVDKAKYFLKNENEREEIAQNGYQAIKANYSLEQGTSRLEEIFSKYL